MFKSPLMKKNRNEGQAGFTLVEIAVVMLVVGIMIATMIPLYNLYLEKIDREDTMVKQKQIDIALTGFKNLRGRYPCPASYTATPGQPNYGVETDCYGSTVAPGSCVSGVCYESSERQIDIGAGMIFPRVERGALPFVSLGLTEDQAYDSYGGRFSYAVTELLTNKSAFRANRGGISIVDGTDPTPQSLVTPPGSVHYFVFSHGPDRIGAYNVQGTQLTDCKGPMFDNENCNTSNVDSKAIYRHERRSEEKVVDPTAAVVIPGAPVVANVNHHYDDFSDFVGIGRQPLWEFAEDAAHVPLDTINLHDAVNRPVIIGRDAVIDPVLPAGSMQVEGDAKLEESRTNRVCDNQTPPHCFETALIGADDPADPRRLKCGSAGAPNAIGNYQIDCAPPTFSCGAGQVLAGVDNDQMPICRDLVKCGASTRRICGVNKPLPGNTPPGRTITLTGGASYSLPVTCSSNGTWVDGTASGVCTCTPGSRTTTSACGANMSGNIITTTTTFCPAGTTTTTANNSACRCVPSTTTRNVPCAAGYSGSITYTDTVTCTGSVPNTTTTQTGNTCVCTPRVETRSVACPSGFNGNINQQRSTTCPANTFGSWTNTSNNCTCKASYQQTRACGSAFNQGIITDTCSYNCSAGMGSAAPLTCSQTGNTCACQAGTADTYTACPAGYSGQVKTTVRTVCPGNTQTTTVDNAACQPIVMSCTVHTTGTNIISTTKQKYAHNDTCTYLLGDPKCSNIRFCHIPQGGNSYATYDCACD